MPMCDTSCYLGVDVGTGSVRTSLVTRTGITLTCVTIPLTVHNPVPDHYEQNCAEIWAAVCSSIKQLLIDSNIESANISGIGFEATCSLVLVDEKDVPLPISAKGQSNTCLLWMDHRAKKETEEINRSHSDVLKFVGGGFSPEQQVPKLLWIKRNLPDIWDRAAHFFDLPDWLTYKATGSTVRSLCSVTCKWGFVAHRGGWDTDFLSEIGLSDLCDLKKLGTDIRAPGDCVPGGLCNSVSLQIGLKRGTSVAVSMIDAHSGALAMLQHAPADTDICKTLGIISGTSTCIMALSEKKTFIPGVWGPYGDAVIPGLWLYEGGQTAAGSALDYLVKSHPSYSGHVSYDVLNADLCKSNDCKLTDIQLHKLTQYVHIQPDLHGNRSPLALPWLRGMISGLDLNTDYNSLLTTYLSAVQGLALGVRLILETISESGGLTFDRIVVCGGLADNPLYIVILASVTKLPVVTNNSNMMCVGGAVLAQSAHTKCDLRTILASLSFDKATVQTYEPVKELFSFYEAKFSVYQKMTYDQLEYRKLMQHDVLV